MRSLTRNWDGRLIAVIVSGFDGDGAAALCGIKEVGGITIAQKPDTVLRDLSCHMSSNSWADRAVHAYREFHADRIVAEVNNGGDLVEDVIRTVDRQGR